MGPFLQARKMGIDIRHHKDRKVHRRSTKSEDIYVKLLVKLYRFLARRTDAGFNKVVLKRLFMSRTNRPPMSIARLIRNMKKEGRDGKTAVVVGTITDDKRIFKVPKLTVCALHVTEAARSRILASGGTIMTFDQLAQQAQRERTPSSCKDHAREEKCTGISDPPQVYHTVTPNHTFAPRDASSNKLVVVVTAVVTRSKQRLVLLTILLHCYLQ